jgi:uncharacterized protein
MKLREITFPDQPPIDSYGPGGFRIGGDWHAGSLVVGPSGIRGIAMPLTPETIAPVLAMAADVDVVLVGQGAEIAPLPAKLRAQFDEAGMGVEIMATPSACRTYNVLLAEERRVAAILAAL